MKKNIIILLTISSILLLTGFVFTNSSDYSLCNPIHYGCREFFNNVGDPLFYGMGALTIVFIILLIIPKAFEPWKKFAIWYVPLATLLFIIYPEPGSGDLFSPYPEQVFRWFSILYVIISVVLIGVHFVRNRRMIK